MMLQIWGEPVPQINPTEKFRILVNEPEGALGHFAFEQVIARFFTLETLHD
jgi:hypothetical protein